MLIGHGAALCAVLMNNKEDLVSHLARWAALLETICVSVKKTDVLISVLDLRLSAL